MMPEEWPIAAEAADRLVDPARLRGPSRLSTVRSDFFLDPSDRLSEQERALMTAMLHDLVATLATAITAAAGQRSVERDPSGLADRLTGAGLLDRPGLVALMLRRADEHRIAAVFASHAGPRRLPLLSRLVGDPDPAVAAAAMTLVVARGRRRDGFGQPRIELSDLDPGDAQALAYAVAAVVADSLEAGQRYASAAAEVLGESGKQVSLDEVTAELVDALERSSGDIPMLLQQCSGEGEIALVAALLARRCGLGPQSAWDHLLNAGEGGLALLARMAGLSRPAAARLIADLGASLGTTTVEQEISCYDSLAEREVAAALSHWRLPRDYRAARVALGASLG
jgi:hypothetical protein